MSKFWLRFVISETLAVLGAFLGATSLNPDQKAAAEKLVADGEAFLATL